MPRVYVQIYGGWNHGSVARYRPRRPLVKRHHVVETAAGIVLACQEWPKDRVSECMALMRIYGAEFNWPDEVKVSVFGPRTNWPGFVIDEMLF